MAILVGLASTSLTADGVVRTPSNLWTTDGRVEAVAADGSLVYLAGSFRQVGRLTGNVAVFDRASGHVDQTFARLEGGDSVGGSAIAPDGVYYVRVRAASDGGLSASTNEVRVALGAGACAAPPSTPGALAATVSGSTVTIRFDAVAAPISRYVVMVGTRAGSTDARFDVGLQTAVSAPAPSGTYFLRVVAENRCGISLPSAEVRVTVG